MFFDERIELERGKISRNSIWISTIFALVCGILRWINVAVNMDHHHYYPKSYYFLTVSTEICIVLSGLACLAAGLYSIHKEHDERFFAQQAAFFNKAGRVHLYTSLAAFSLFLPFSLFLATTVNFASVSTDSVALNLSFLLIGYLLYAFKKRDIYFNYSIIEAPRYSLAVLKNIGKLGLGTLCCLGLSVFGAMIGDLLLHSSHTSTVVLSCLAWWCVVFLMLTLIYAIFSVLEQISYQKRRVLSGATLATLLTVILCKAIYGILEGWLATSGLTAVQQLTALNHFAFLPNVAALATLLFLVYHSSEYTAAIPDTLTRVGTLLILAATVPGDAVKFLFSLVQTIFLKRIMIEGDIRLRLLLSDINEGLLGITHLLFLVGFALLIIGPIRKGLASRGHVVAVILSFAAFGAEIFLYTQLPATYFFLINNLVDLARYLYLSIYLAHIGKHISKAVQI